MVAYTPDDVHDVVAHLDEVLTIRKSNAAEAAAGDAGAGDGGEDSLPLPHYIIFCTNYHIIEDEPIIRQLLNNRAGITMVMLGTAMTHLPKECHLVLNMQGSEGYLHSSEGDTRKVDFEYPDRGLIHSFSRRMAPAARAGCGAKMPPSPRWYPSWIFMAPAGWKSWKFGACGGRTIPTRA